ncbi:kinesin family member 2/24 [Saprolegnia diclina VS20]|uniref:Kinesin-like protein n=1 Tax=Saprolegnia diclina (strain VS20) TaxID=1156394 RepID=T0RRA0_SAPDV|nr:kinesin family member 2/24 [Saprolegnia diclina VS20]EQC32622.1 kinesin family member 2/24 [Saprolegnia diclina VS20]|eukprot:XP_008614123.1 kinesin family member 2/24 [Saprolegnia diclina VS20]
MWRAREKTSVSASTASSSVSGLGGAHVAASVQSNGRRPSNPRVTPTKIGKPTTKTKPTTQAIAEIEKNREDRRKAMALVKKEREQESLNNERNGTPGDVDFQRMIKQFREQDHQELSHTSKGEMKITICVRKRPVNKREVRVKDYDCITCWHPKVIIHDCKLKVDGITKYLDSNAFAFDHSFDEHTSNATVYKYTAQPLIQFVFNEGGRATVFAYGQTGSGKTYTMEGIQSQAATDLFAQLDKWRDTTGQTLELWMSFFEIYGGQCQDLLRQKRLTIREDGNGEVQIVDLDEVRIHSEAELLQTMQRGNALRTTHATEMNDQSSRSHSICQLHIREAGSMKLHGKLSLIDLAGSERGADTKSHNRQRRMESSEINKSLLALKECFRALDSGGRGAHIPFRASKLTQVLKDSFVNAKARTVMIAAVSPCASSADHTINTLRYADRVKEKAVEPDDGSADPLHVHVKHLMHRPGSSPEKPPPPPPPPGNSLADLMSEAVSRNLTDIALSDDDDELHDDDASTYSDADHIDYVDPRDSTSSQDDIKMLHSALRNQTPDGAIDDEDHSLEDLHEVVQTLYEEQENLLSSHMTAIQENAELLTEEGMLLSDVQGEAVVDYDIDQYAQRLDEILAKKEATIRKLRLQLSQFRTRCKEEEAAAKRVAQVPFY